MAKPVQDAWDGVYRRVDVHVHSRPFAGVQYRGSASAYVRKVRAAGIDAVVLLAPGEACDKAVRRFGGDFVIPVPMYYLREMPGRDIRGDMERWLDRGARGIKFIAPLHKYSDERYWPLYQLVLDRKAVAVFHTGYLAARSQPEIPPVEMDDMRAAHVDAVARRFPDLKILMAHFSNPWWEEAWKVCWSKPNVYADLSGATALHRSMSMWGEMFAPDGHLLRDSLAKICFASDVCYLHNGPHEFAPYVEFYQRLLDRVNAPQSLRHRVWAGNAIRLFGLKSAR
ncbi:MAG: hypothetical protein BIFFINMI_02378 [Phycisphaerae bacterium]|nr:hypothetical protein [Phycisphaerae bacterium]